MFRKYFIRTILVRNSNSHRAIWGSRWNISGRRLSSWVDGNSVCLQISFYELLFVLQRSRLFASRFSFWIFEPPLGRLLHLELMSTFFLPFFNIRVPVRQVISRTLSFMNAVALSGNERLHASCLVKTLVRRACSEFDVSTAVRCRGILWPGARVDARNCPSSLTHETRQYQSLLESATKGKRSPQKLAANWKYCEYKKAREDHRRSYEGHTKAKALITFF